VKTTTPPLAVHYCRDADEAAALVAFLREAHGLRAVADESVRPKVTVERASPERVRELGWEFARRVFEERLRQERREADALNARTEAFLGGLDALL
jgi:hypothetical protein